MGGGASGQVEILTEVKENTILGLSHLDNLTGSPQTKKKEENSANIAPHL